MMPKKRSPALSSAAKNLLSSGLMPEVLFRQNAHVPVPVLTTCPEESMAADSVRHEPYPSGSVTGSNGVLGQDFGLRNRASPRETKW